MLRAPAVLGLSMLSRSNRRLLVATTYVTFLVSMTAVIIFLTPRRKAEAVWICLIIAYNVVSRAVFGRLVKDTVLPELHGEGLINLNLAPARRRGNVPDEREIAVRNAAHYQAYRALAIYSIVLWLALPVFLSLRSSPAAQGLELLAMPLLGMALTLPQAVVLWTEPDVPEETRA